MEPIDVTARFDRDGKITPLNFYWQGATYPVDSIGRTWNDGDSRHVLVMAPGGKVFELVYVGSVGRWFMGRFGVERRMA